MSMQIRNEAHSQTAINAYQENRMHAEKAHEKLATGLKIVNPKDDSSAWAMSERMRNLIRAFSQDDQNVQNDSALVRTAEYAIDQIVQNLRYMKELAVNSANDSNTDDDRRVLQKEFLQRLETIDEIAYTTEYNGRFLLNGTWASYESKILEEFYRDIPIDRLVKNFVGGDNTSAASNLQSLGNPNLWATTADVGFKRNSTSTYHTAILDFSGMQRKYGYDYMLHNQGFTLLCGGCSQYVNIRFNASVTADQSTTNHIANTKVYNGTTYINDMAGEFIIGIKGVTNADELANAIFEGVKALQGNGVRRSYTATFNGSNNGTPKTISSTFVNTENEVLLDANHDLSIGRNSDGKIFIRQRGGPALLFKAGLIPNENISDLPDADLPFIEVTPLWVQHGSEAGQRFHIFINDLSTTSLGLENTDVNTISNARSAIARCESAIDYALNEATTMGAYLQRLDATYSNITTLSENVQASESTIRNADIAKEMVNFARYRILTGSSQAMVSQFNINEQVALGLLN